MMKKIQNNVFIHENKNAKRDDRRGMGRYIDRKTR